MGGRAEREDFRRRDRAGQGIDAGKKIKERRMLMLAGKNLTRPAGVVDRYVKAAVARTGRAALAESGGGPTRFGPTC